MMYHYAHVLYAVFAFSVKYMYIHSGYIFSKLWLFVWLNTTAVYQHGFENFEISFWWKYHVNTMQYNHTVSANRILWVYAGFWWYHGILVMHLQDSDGATTWSAISPQMHQFSNPCWYTVVVFNHTNNALLTPFESQRFHGITKVNTSHTVYILVLIRSYLHISYWNNHRNLYIFANEMCKIQYRCYHIFW